MILLITVTENASEVTEVESIVESEKSKGSVPKLRRRKVKEVSEVGEVSTFLHETDEQIAAWEAQKTQEKIMQNAILLVQSHERARVGRSIAIQGEIFNRSKCYRIIKNCTSK